MKKYNLSGILTLLAFLGLLVACEEDTTTIGSVIANGEVKITIDTSYYDLNARSLEVSSFDSKTGNLLLGNIQEKEYGNLSCSFVTKLMCASNLEIDDSLFYANRVDSCKLILGAQRDDITGDSLAPQILTVYKLTKQLPEDIDNNFNPEGYYDPSRPFASRSYTVSQIASSDSSFYKESYVNLSLNLPVDFGKEIFTAYKEEPEIFQWPKTMAEKFLPGLYIKSTFGKGCIANIQSVYVAVFYHSLSTTTKVEDGDTITTQVHKNHVVYPFTVSPEVVSSNQVSYMPSQKITQWNQQEDGSVVITTPGGYMATFDFPAKALIDKYQVHNTNLSRVNDLNLYLPAEPFGEDTDISVAETLMLIKKSEYEDFFAENKVPDNMSSFTGVYDPAKKRYAFSTMRNYFVELLKKDTLTPEDTEFMIVPVELGTESVSDYYGNATTYVVKCVPYTSKPTMTLINAREAMVTFSFSTQIID